MGAREELAAVLDPRVTASLGTAEWACDPLPSCPQYAHVNPDWLRAIIAEAKAVREWLTSPALARLLDEARREAWDEGVRFCWDDLEPYDLEFNPYRTNSGRR